ncbi:MAG: hypothetical protein RL693_518 [Verrucomicrobiota bacterium]|jgi:hypothetical protein
MGNRFAVQEATINILGEPQLHFYCNRIHKNNSRPTLPG